MATKTFSVHVHGEKLLRFPGYALVIYQLWLSDGLSETFDKGALFRRLIESGAYQNQRWNHSSKGEHGPFAVSKIRSDHYEPISLEKLKQNLHERLIPASQADFDRYLDPWPTTSVLQQRLKALLHYMQSNSIHWYYLAVSLEEEQYWSDRYREVPILDHFEEWVGVNPTMSMIYMLQVIRD